MALFPVNPNIVRWVQGATPATFRSQYMTAVRYHQKPALGSSITVHATITLSGSTQVITTDITNPDVPRNLVLTGNTGATEVITVNGKDAGGNTISENFTLNGTASVVGAKAFGTVTDITCPTGSHTFVVTCGNVLGLGNKIANAAFVLVKLFNGSTDSGTVAVSSTALESNTYAPAGTLDGAKYVDLIYLV